MCQFLGDLSATAVHRAAHICIARMPSSLTCGRADDTDVNPNLNLIDRCRASRSVSARSITSAKEWASRSCSYQGSAGYASFWQEQVGAFAKRFEVVTFDHRGIGQSDPARMGYTVERMAVDAIALLDALEIRRAHVVGHSTGGRGRASNGDRTPEPARKRRPVGHLDQGRRLFPPALRLAQRNPASGSAPASICNRRHYCGIRAGGLPGTTRNCVRSRPSIWRRSPRQKSS